MNVIIKYDRVDFFGSKQYTEDSKNNVDFSDLKKVFSALKNNCSIAINIFNNEYPIYNYTLYWDSSENFEHKTLTCREYESVNSYKEYVWSFDGCKKFFYDLIKNT